MGLDSMSQFFFQHDTKKAGSGFQALWSEYRGGGVVSSLRLKTHSLKS